MWLAHATGETSYKVLYQHTMYVISLSNISLKPNIKQVTRGEFKLANLYNILRVTTFCALRHVICCRSFTNDTLHTVLITFSVTI